MVTVVVDASPALAFREILVGGEGPIGFSQALTAPPYRFSIGIPPGTRPRRYHLTADGFTEPGHGVSSEPVDILVERPDSPLSLTAEPSLLDLEHVGGQSSRIAAVGKFVDAQRVDVSESTYVGYVSDNLSVATVTGESWVTAVGPGSAKITIRYKEKSTVVPVTVRKPMAGHVASLTPCCAR